MGIFSKLFGFSEENGSSNNKLKIQFGHYSDNNKSLTKTNYWYKADELFKEKKYFESVKTLFNYISDDKLPNFVFTENANNEINFELYQGSKKIIGYCSEQGVHAEVKIATMTNPSVPVMRRLLETNYNLYYSRFAYKNGVLYMLLDSDIETSNPNKMYYGLKELAVNADKYDDQLTQDFSLLKSVDIDHINPISDAEFSLKLKYLKKWISETSKAIDELNKDTFSGGIAYMLLALLQRIDCMLVPEGKLLREIDKIAGYYWSNIEEDAPVEVNKKMQDGLNAILEWSETDLRINLYGSLSTFSMVQPIAYDKINETLQNSIANMVWYRDNKYPQIANQVLEYGLTYSLFVYSLPKPFTQFIEIFMQVNYSNFYKDLGWQNLYYYPSSNDFVINEIRQAIDNILISNKEKYPILKFDTDKLAYTDLVAFNKSFLEQCKLLNFNSK